MKELVLLYYCGKKSCWQNKASLNVSRLLFRILVWSVTISDWPMLLVCISFYNPQVCLREFSRATQWLSHTYALLGHSFWACHTSTTRRFILLVDLQNKRTRKGLTSKIYVQHKSVPSVLPQRASARSAKTQSFHTTFLLYNNSGRKVFIVHGQDSFQVVRTTTTVQPSSTATSWRKAAKASGALSTSTAAPSCPGWPLPAPRRSWFATRGSSWISTTSLAWSWAAIQGQRLYVISFITYQWS